MKKVSINQKRKAQRTKKTRVKILGYTSRPRLSVHRSNKHISLQIIDDSAQKTLASASDVKIKVASSATRRGGGKTRTEVAFDLGKEIATKAIEKKVKKVVFDRGPYAYHGIIKAVADGAREGGLIF